MDFIKEEKKNSPGGEAVKNNGFKKYKEDKSKKDKSKKEKEKNSKSGKMRIVKSIKDQQMLGFKHRSMVFPLNVAVTIREEEFLSRVFQQNKHKFREVI